MLEMGEPVSIIDLAKDMIRFSGLEPGQRHRDRHHRPRGRARSCTSSCSTPTSGQSRRRRRRSCAPRARPSIPRGSSTCSTRSACSCSRATPPAWRRRRLARAREAGPPTAAGEAIGRSRPTRQPAAPRLSPLGSMVLFAFSLQDQVEKYGAYVGIAASSAWRSCRCSTSPRRAKSSACAIGRAVRPSAPRRSRRTPSRNAEAALREREAPAPVALPHMSRSPRRSLPAPPTACRRASCARSRSPRRVRARGRGAAPTVGGLAPPEPPTEIAVQRAAGSRPAPKPPRS